MKPKHRKEHPSPGPRLRLSLLLCLAFLLAGCSVWNPWGYKKDWPVWKKTAFFVGPGHCPVCYCVGGGVIALVKGTEEGGPAVADPDCQAPSVADQPSQEVNDSQETKEEVSE